MLSVRNMRDHTIWGRGRWPAAPPHIYTYMYWGAKAIGGGWTTSCWMHVDIKWPCIFGCEANDEIGHYLTCPTLCFIACAQLSVEDSIFVVERLCFVQPSIDKLKRLALTHTTYHSCKFDSEIIALMNFYITFPETLTPWRRIQDLAYGYSRTFKYMVT